MSDKLNCGEILERRGFSSERHFQKVPSAERNRIFQLNEIPLVKKIMIKKDVRCFSHTKLYKIIYTFRLECLEFKLITSDWVLIKSSECRKLRSGIYKVFTNYRFFINY